MSTDELWDEAKSKERFGENFVKTVFKSSAFKIMDFGIEHHNQEIISEIRDNYASSTNMKLHFMPDFVVVDKETKSATIIEAKYRNYPEFFNKKKTSISFNYNSIKSYCAFWKEAVLIIVMNKKPYCVCVDVSKIDLEKHYVDKIMGKHGSYMELWRFSDIYEDITTRFPKISKENVLEALKRARII